MKRLAAGAVVIVVVAALLGGTGAGAQKAEVLPLEVSEVDTSRHPEVHAVLTAPPGLAGVPLEPGAVTAIEAGRDRPVEVVRLPDDRLEVVLVFDTSGSMQGAPFTAAKEAASAFIAQLPADARVALVAFGTTPQVASPLAEDRIALIRAVQGLAARGETALYDAVRLGTAQFSGDPNSRRQLIVLSDGGDTASSVPVETAAEAVTAAGARLDVVELVTTESARSALDLLAAAGAGQVAPATDPSALAGIYDALAKSLANEYALTWRSTAHDSTDVVVRLEQGEIVAEHTLRLDYPAAPVTTTSAAPVRAEPRPEPATEREPSSAAWMLVVGGACVGVSLLIILLNILLPARRRRALARLGATPDTTTSLKSSALSDLTVRVTSAADGALARNGRRGALERRLEQAGIPLRAGEYGVLAVSAVVVGVIVGALAAGPVVALLLGGLAAAAAHVVPNVLCKRRRRQFSDQLGDTLQLLAGSLRAGYGLLQAIDAVSREAPQPTNSEFRRLVIETRLGRDLSESLDAMAERLDTEDFAWVVQAIDINREVGGDLAEVLDTVGGTIRQRNQVLRQVKALTAEGRMSAYVLLALPFCLAAAMHIINPEYLRLLTFGPGLFMSGAAAVMLAIGALWFRALCKIDY